MYGKHLKELREAKKLSQDQVAQELNVSRQAISKWENDKTFPDIDNLIRLSRLYGVTLDELVGVEREKEETTEKDKEEEKTGCSNQSILGWVMIAVAVCSCWISPVGIVASLIILYKSREINSKKWRWLVRAVALTTMAVSIHGSYIILTAMYWEGQGSVEYLG